MTRHQKSLSGDGDMGVLPAYVATLHYVGNLHLGDAVTRRQKYPDGDGDAATKKFLMVTVTRHHVNLRFDGDIGVFPSSFIDILHNVWILYLGDAVTRHQRIPVGDGDAATKTSCW